MGRITTTSIVLLGAFLLQVIFGSSLTILGVTPNFLMVAVIIIAFMRGSKEGIFVGFIAGLLFDLIGATVVGPTALTLTLTGFVAGTLKEQIFAASWLLPLTILGIASFLSESVYLLLMMVLGLPIEFGQAVLIKVIPGALYAMLIAVIAFPALTKFLRLGMSTEVNTFKRIS